MRLAFRLHVRKGVLVSTSGSVSTSNSPMASVLEGINALRLADREGDVEALGELLAPDVVFRSPLVSTIRFEGREEVMALHRDVFVVLKDRDAAEPLVNDTMACFNFHARVHGADLDGIVYATFNEHGKIIELKVFGRPMSALAALFAELPIRVSRRRGGPVQSALVRMAGWPLFFLLRAIDIVGPLLLPFKGSTPTR